MKESLAEKLMLNTKNTKIYEFTNQIQRNVIALEIIKEMSGTK